MSGLSMADMRRIGERRNTEAVSTAPARGSFLPKLNAKLPFSSRAATDKASEAKTGSVAPPKALTNNAAVNRLNNLQNGHTTPPIATVEPAGAPPALPTAHAGPSSAGSVSTDPFAEAPMQLSAMTPKQAAQPLQSEANIKAGIGAGMGAAAGYAATGMTIALPAGLVLGGMGGLALAKRGHAMGAIHGKTVAVKRKQAETLIAALEETCMPFGVNTPRFALSINQSAALQIISSGKPIKRKLDVKLGLGLLAGMSVEQLQALFAQSFARLLAEEATQGEPVRAETVASLDRLHAKKIAKFEKSKASDKARSKLEAFGGHVHSANFAWSNTARECDRQADDRAAAVVGPAPLAGAILAQGLIAARFSCDEATPFVEHMRALRSGYDQSDLNQALQSLAASSVDAEHYLKGMPLQLLERMTALDTSIPVPQIPAIGPAFRSLDGKLQTQLDKTLAGIKPSRTERSLGKHKKDKSTKSETKAKATKAKRPGLLARLTKKRATGDLASMQGSAEQLYEADTLFKNDTGVGLDAYQSLVDANPRWALARLRLAEAQIECGLGDGVSNLMMAAEQLPSAMPTILGMLQGALPMVSPLEEEPLRQVIERMWSDADAMADERAQIDLTRLEAARLDDTDRTTLETLFAHANGLREAWVFNVPCVYVPNVPHHAIIGLAPRLRDEDVQMLAMQIAEHAAIIGTVAVHIETGKPQGGLGDALASQPSLWRAGRT